MFASAADAASFHAALRYRSRNGYAGLHFHSSYNDVVGGGILTATYDTTAFCTFSTEVANLRRRFIVQDFF